MERGVVPAVPITPIRAVGTASVARVDWPAMSPRVVTGARLLAFGLVGSPRRSGSRQDPPDGVEDEVEPKLELVGVVEAGREQLTADTREVRVRIRRYLGDHR